MKKTIKNLINYVIILLFLICSNSYALTINNYNRYCSEGKILNVVITFNDSVVKYNKYGHYKLGDEYMPSTDPSDPLSNEGIRDMANKAVAPDTTYKIYGEIDEEDIDYSYLDIENLGQEDRQVYELQAKLDALKVGNQVQEKSGYGKYNLRNGKNLIAFIKFAYEFYKNNSGEYRVGIKDDKLLKGTRAEGNPICPMELLEEYTTLNSTSSVELNNGFDDKFRDCIDKWEYIGSKDIENSDKIFETLEDIYMGLVYLYPALKVLQNKGGIDLDSLSDEDRAAIFSVVYEIKGMQPITSINVSDEQLTKKFSKIGLGNLIGALIEDDELDFSVAESIYRYMIEIKHKNNPQNLARWVSEYEEIYGKHEPLDAERRTKFLKAYNKVFVKYCSDVSRETGLDYVGYGYVENPEAFESKHSLREMREELGKYLKENFSDSGFYKNINNAQYVAKSYMMAKKICENTSFIELTDIYASDIRLVEHSYGYDSSEVMLSDTQVVSLDFPLADDGYDTDRDGISDKEELGNLEEVDISKLLEVYIKYNEIPKEEADKLRKDPIVKMYNYISNPVLPDSDFDGRNDLRDDTKLDNTYQSVVETNNYMNVKIDYTQDYRYFLMDQTKYYPELSEMGLVLSNMASKKLNSNGTLMSKKWENKNVGEKITKIGLNEYMWYFGMEHRVDHTNDEVPYMLGQHDVIFKKGKVNNIKRNVITLVIGENEKYKDIISANYDGKLDKGSGKAIHHQGYDYYADEIYNVLLNYDKVRSVEGWNNAYWIVGYGTGGSVANLVAKKLIDYKNDNKDIYCYTYQAPNVINRSKISPSSEILNTKYDNIFNIENLDDITLNLVGERSGFEKYGVRKTINLCETTLLNKILQNIPLYKNNKENIETEIDLIDDIYSDEEEYYSNKKYVDTYLDIYSILLTKNINKYDSDISNEIIERVRADNENFDSINERATHIYNRYPKLYIEARDVKQIRDVIKEEPISIFREVIGNFTLNEAKKRLVKYIIEIGKWYTKNVATYQGYLETKPIYELELDKKYIVKRIYTDKAGTYERNILTDNIRETDVLYKDLTDEETYNTLIEAQSQYNQDKTGFKLKVYKNIINDWYTEGVVRASEEQLDEYVKNYEQIIKGISLYYYPNRYIDRNNKNYSGAGDDCVRFAWTVFTALNKEFPNKIEEYFGWGPLYIDSSRLSGSGPAGDKINRDKVEYAMYKLGFDIYDANYKKVEKYKLDSGKEYVINPIYSDFKLESGDFLVKNGHVTFYLGGTDDKVSDGFGWGEVRSKFPQRTSFAQDSSNRFYGDFWRVYRYTGRER